MKQQINRKIDRESGNRLFKKIFKYPMVLKNLKFKLSIFGYRSPIIKFNNCLPVYMHIVPHLAMHVQ